MEGWNDPGAFRGTALTVTLALAACASGPSPSPAADDSPTPTAATSPAPATADASGSGSGYYTTAQATQGMEVFGRTCSECHELREMRGADFMFEWEGSSVGRLYRLISRTMPDDDPGGLPTEEYLAVVAYILQLNEMPAGPDPLTLDMEALNAMRIAP